MPAEALERIEKIRRPRPNGSGGSHMDSSRKESFTGRSRGHCLQVEHRGDGGAVGRAGQDVFERSQEL